MAEVSKIQLNPSTIFNVPLKTYVDDFTFIVNGEEFKTSRLISDLISAKICKIHSNDPTTDKYFINTSQKGDFSHILNLVKFNQIDIPEKDLPFILEVIEILEIDFIDYEEKEKDTKLTVDNIISLIQKHERYGKFYSKRFSEEIDFISSHFFTICEKQKEELKNLSLSTLIKITTNEKIELNSEDQLLDFVNELYANDRKYSILYETVQFTNVSVEMMKNFLSIYDNDDMSHELWQQLSIRLQEELKNLKENKKRYKKEASNGIPKEEVSNKEGVKFIPKKYNSFSGILNHLRTKSNGKIENEVSITASSIYSSADRNQPRSVVFYDDENSELYSKNQPNNWLCFDFKEHRIIPTDYTVKSYRVGENYRSPKSWAIEVSNNNSSWETIDEQNNCSYLNGSLLTYTFHIQKQQSKEFRYIRMRSTGPCWNGEHYLNIGKFEIYGYLI